MLTKINFEAMIIFRALVLLAGLTVSFSALAAPPANQGPPAAGKAVSIVGRVLIRNEDKSGSAVRELKVGESILSGDVVNTRSDATVKLIMTDRSIIDLGASTLFKVDEWIQQQTEDRRVALTLGYGKIRASVNAPVGPKGKFTIKTKAATMGVRGTEFIVTADFADSAAPAAKPGTSGAGSGSGAGKSVTTQVTVIHGKVEFKDQARPAGKPTELTTGKQLTTVATLVGDNAVQRSAANAPAPKVVDIPAPQLKSMMAEAKVQDQTFKQAVVIDTANKSQPSLGTSTMQSIVSSAPPPPQFGPKPGEFGLPGTFVPGVNTVPPNALPPGVPVNLVVTFVRN